MKAGLSVEPQQFGYSVSDNQIGHFLVKNYTMRDCLPAESCDEEDAEEIRLCEPGEGGCESFYKCAVVEGNFPHDGFDISVRTDGEADGPKTQEGVYLKSVAIYDENDDAVSSAGWRFFQSDGITEVLDVDCTFEAVVTTNSIEEDMGDKIRLCIVYQVDPAKAEPDSNVEIWIDANSGEPCHGPVFSTVAQGALLRACDSFFIDDQGDCGEINCYGSIQGAMEAAAAAGPAVLWVAPGDYFENVAIGNDITMSICGGYGEGDCGTLDGAVVLLDPGSSPDRR